MYQAASARSDSGGPPWILSTVTVSPVAEELKKKVSCMESQRQKFIDRPHRGRAREKIQFMLCLACDSDHVNVEGKKEWIWRKD